MDSLSGKIALVTGSSRGIGRAAGLKLASLGAKVIFHGVRQSEKLDSAVREAGNGAGRKRNLNPLLRSAIMSAPEWNVPTRK